MGDQSFFKKLKNRLFSTTYALRRVYTAGEKSLKVTQEVREITKDLLARNVELTNAVNGITRQELGGDPAGQKDHPRSLALTAIPIEVRTMARSMMRVIVENSHPYYLVVYLIGNKLLTEWATDKRHVSMSIREETSLTYLRDVLTVHPLQPHNHLFMIINLEDSCYEGPFASFVWNFCGKAPTLGIVWPNNYAQANFGGKLSKKDELSWEDKRDNCCFYGSSTGAIDPLNNDRVKVCLLAQKKNSALLTAKITDWVQMDCQTLPFEKAAISSRFVSIEDQLKSKIVLSIDGNVTAWDRIAWVLNSNSLLFKYESDYYDWFYDKLKDEHNYVLIKKSDDLFDKITFYLKHEQLSKEIIKRANHLVSEELIYEKHRHFSRWTLENYRIKFFD